MPVYDYECGECGVFTALRPMAKCQEPLSCPDCGQPAPRAFLSAPALANMSAERRTAHAINEKAAHEPRSSAIHMARVANAAAEIQSRWR